MESRTERVARLRAAGLWSSTVFDAAPSVLRGLALSLGFFGISDAELAYALANDVERSGNVAALEALLLRVARPTLRIEEGVIAAPPMPIVQADAGDLERLGPVSRAVGRVEFHNAPIRWGGAAVVVEKLAPSRTLVVCSRRTARRLATRAGPEGALFQRAPDNNSDRIWATIDFTERLEEGAGHRFTVQHVEYLADDLEADVALLEVRHDGVDAPEPITLSERTPQINDPIAVIGHAAVDCRSELGDLQPYFVDVGEEKRIVVGRILTSDARSGMTHDGLTLGGFCGAPIFDVREGSVIGLNSRIPVASGHRTVSAATLRRLITSRTLSPLAKRRTSQAETEVEETEHPAEGLVDRKGFEPRFLGREFLVAWPRQAQSFRRGLARPVPRKGLVNEIAYTNFSLMFCTTRRLPVLAAINFDASAAQPVARRPMPWCADMRIGPEVQANQAFYREREFERLPLASLSSVSWGANAAVAAHDVYHFTNCAPRSVFCRHVALLWDELERAVLASPETIGQQACIFTGPVCRDNDPPVGTAELSAPREFWKIVAARDRRGGLHASGYVMTRGAIILDLLRSRGQSASEGFEFTEYRVLQLPIQDLQSRLGLDFTQLVAADVLTRSDEAKAALAEGQVMFNPASAVSDLLL